MRSTSLKYLLDSVVVIDHFNGIKPATEFLLEYGDECALSAITRAEVLTGFQLKAEPLACELLDVFSTLPLTAKTADSAARLRRSERLKLPDAFQAAVASEHDLTLVTWNTRDFRPGNSPKVLVPYRL